MINHRVCAYEVLNQGVWVLIRGLPVVFCLVCHFLFLALVLV